MGEAKRRAAAAVAARAKRLPDMDVDDAPDLAGRLRVTFVAERDFGYSVYFVPAELPGLMTRIGGLRRPDGTRWATTLRDAKSWAGLRQAAVACLLRKEKPDQMMRLLLWLYFHHPENLHIADMVHTTLAERGRACVTIAYSARTGNMTATVGVGYQPGAQGLAELEFPAGFSHVHRKGAEPPHGHA